MRYFIGFLVTIGLIIILIVMLFGGGGDKAKVPETSKTLVSYANTSAETRLTIDGPVQADQTHKQVQITVSNSLVTYKEINGYDGTVANTKTFANNTNAYATFLSALSHAGYTKGDLSKELKDERGYCPQNNRYIYELIQDGETIQRFWTTSCGKPKSFLGNAVITNQLFEAQVPDYFEVSNGTNLS